MAGLALHLLTETRIRLERSRQTWEYDRLNLAATAAARRALQAFADGEWEDQTRAIDPETPHVLWAYRGTDPAGIHTETRLMDGQRRFDLNNVMPGARGLSPSPEAVRIATELLRLHGDPAPEQRIGALVRRLALVQPAAESENADPVPLDWDGLAALPEFGIDYLRNPAGSRPERPRHYRSVASFAGLLPHPAQERPLPVNVNTADRETLLSLLGADQRRAVERLIEYRRDTLFRSAAEAGARTGLPLDRLARLEPWITVRSEWFEIESRSTADGREVVLRVLARRRAGGQVAVIRWTRLAQQSNDA